MRTVSASARPMRSTPRVRRTFAYVLLSFGAGGCTHDFNIFEPVNESDASSPAASDSGDPLEASGPGNDAAEANGLDSSSSGGEASCGSDCKIEALSCAGTCAQIEQSCAAACASTDATCQQGCLTSENKCAGQCVTDCETCTSGEGCVDQAGCAAAAP
jgi:hypothetical protein